MRNRTRPVFYDYKPVYEIWIQYITVFKRYRPETIFHSEIKGHNSDINQWILSVIELDLHFIIIYLCMKYESNTSLYSKDIVQKPFFRTYVRTNKGDAISSPPLHYKWRGHNKNFWSYRLHKFGTPKVLRTDRRTHGRTDRWTDGRTEWTHY